MVETERVLFTNSILTVNLVPALIVTAFGLAGIAFFLWLMGYDLVRVDGTADFQGGYGKKKSYNRVRGVGGQHPYHGHHHHLKEDWIIDLEDRIIAMEDGHLFDFRIK